jgi:hypothetical protein
MKKLLILSVFALFAFSSANVYGQNTGNQPSVGSIHQYWVNGTFSAPSTAGATSKYTWWISTTPADLLQKVTSSADFTPTSNYNVTGGTLAKNGIEITWNPSSAGNTYYLVVQEDGASPLCTNIKGYAIQPKNNFELTFAMLAKDGTTLGDNLSRCAPDIAISAAGTVISYNYGTDSYLFKLSAKGLYTTWSLDYSFLNTLGGSADSYEVSTDGGTSYTASTSSKTGLVIPASATGTKDVLVRVKLVNGTANEGLADQSLKLTLANVKDAGNNPVTKIYSSNGTTDITSTPSQTQTVKGRPATTGIQSN